MILMPKRESIDAKTRDRIVAYLKLKMDELGFSTGASMARHLGVAPSTVTRALTGQRRVGLDLVLAIHRKLHIPADRLLDIDPTGTPKR